MDDGEDLAMNTRKPGNEILRRVIGE